MSESDPLLMSKSTEKNPTDEQSDSEEIEPISYHPSTASVQTLHEDHIRNKDVYHHMAFDSQGNRKRFNQDQLKEISQTGTFTVHDDDNDRVQRWNVIGYQGTEKCKVIYQERMEYAGDQITVQLPNRIWKPTRLSLWTCLLSFWRACLNLFNLLIGYPMGNSDGNDQLEDLFDVCCPESSCCCCCGCNKQSFHYYEPKITEKIEWQFQNLYSGQPSYKIITKTTWWCWRWIDFFVLWGALTWNSAGILLKGWLWHGCIEAMWKYDLLGLTSIKKHYVALWNKIQESRMGHDKEQSLGMFGGCLSSVLHIFTHYCFYLPVGVIAITLAHIIWLTLGLVYFMFTVTVSLSLALSSPIWTLVFVVLNQVRIWVLHDYRTGWCFPLVGGVAGVLVVMCLLRAIATILAIIGHIIFSFLITCWAHLAAFGRRMYDWTLYALIKILGKIPVEDIYPAHKITTDLV